MNTDPHGQQDGLREAYDVRVHIYLAFGHLYLSGGIGRCLKYDTLNFSVAIQRSVSTSKFMISSYMIHKLARSSVIMTDLQDLHVPGIYEKVYVVR